jgi:regulator of replication initiation timing
MLKGKNAYPAKISESPLGTISSMEHVVRSLDDHTNQLQQTLATTLRKIEELKPHLASPFAHEEKLQSLIQRQQEIMDALDLTKDQASNRLSAEEVPVVEEIIQPENVVSIESSSGTKMAIA